MTERNTIRARKWAAILCLTAVLLLQGPFAQAAWLSSMACCMTDKCPVPGHHHQSQAQQSQANNLPMDCGHNMNQMSDCKMSCCKTTDETAINVALFVMPDVQITPEPLAAAPQTFRSARQMISRSEKPQSPPPKSLLS